MGSLWWYTFVLFVSTLIYSIHCSSYWVEPPSPFILIVLNTLTTFTNNIPINPISSTQQTQPWHNQPYTKHSISLPLGCIHISDIFSANSSHSPLATHLSLFHSHSISNVFTRILPSLIVPSYLIQMSHPSAAHPSSLTLPHRYISQHNYDAGVNDSRILLTIRRIRILPHPTSLTNSSYMNVVDCHSTEWDTNRTWFES